MKSRCGTELPGLRTTSSVFVKKFKTIMQLVTRRLFQLFAEITDMSELQSWWLNVGNHQGY